jgi:hypothetical protein
MDTYTVGLATSVSDTPLAYDRGTEDPGQCLAALLGVFCWRRTAMLDRKPVKVGSSGRGQVVLWFAQAIQWVALTPEQAEAFARSMLDEVATIRRGD